MDRQSTSSLLAPAKLQEQRNSGNREKACNRCRSGFAIDEQYYSIADTKWHVQCFLCAQCMLPLVGGIYYQFEKRMYCEHDFNTLYAPICGKCDKYVVGHVIRTANRSFHLKCFNCDHCETPLDKSGAYCNMGKLLCLNCSQLVPKEKIYNCTKCHQSVDETELLMFKNDPYHAYHFNCKKCDKQLDKNARNVKDELFCQRCFDFQCEVCFGCKVVIDPEFERSTFSMGKHYHMEHFRCATCFSPFNGHEHYELNGQAYCKKDFLEQIGNHCSNCDKIFPGSMFWFFNKRFCPNCYRCRGCDKMLNHKDKVMEFDMLPLCKKCLGHKNFQKTLKDKAESKLT